MVAQDGLPNSSGGGTSQKYSYDGVGRLSEVQDTAAGQCTVRRYEFDADSNRTAKKTYAPGSNGACDTSSSPTTKSNTFDDADRIIKAGYEYDAFGRTTTVPQVDAGGTGAMTATYYANDLARSITQDGKTQTLDLDPMLRAQTKTKSGGWSGTQTYAYSDDSDSPAWLAEGSSWTRWIAGLDGSVDATQKSDGSLAWTVSNIRGDMIAEAGGGGLMNVRQIDEFGNAEGGLPASRPYGFHGSKERETLTDGGTIAMGVRLYVPGSGRFLQTDPVLGGTANPYEYPSDPVGDADLSGKFSMCSFMPTKPRVTHASRKSRPIVHASVKFSCSGIASNRNLKLTLSLSYRRNDNDAWHMVTINATVGRVRNGKMSVRLDVDAFCKRGVNDYQATAAATFKGGGYGFPIAQGPWSTLNCPRGVKGRD